MKLIVALEEAGYAVGAGPSVRARYSAAICALPRSPFRADLTAVGDVLAGLVSDVGKLLFAHQELVESSGSADQDERHIQNSGAESFGYEGASGVERKVASKLEPQTKPLIAIDSTGNGGQRPDLPVRNI